MWKDLNMQERSEVISLALKQGIYSLKDIRELYDNSNQFEDGGFRLVGYRDNKPLYTNGTIDSSTGSPMLFDENYNPLSGKTFIYNLPAAEKTSTRKAQESAIKLRNPLAEATPEQVLSASTLGADKWGQFSFYAGMARRALQGKDISQDFIYGNTGVINEGYAEKHPYITTATNLVTDIAVPGVMKAPKDPWSLRLYSDIITDPVVTYRAFKKGEYIKDFQSLIRNVRKAKQHVQEGINYTKQDYKTLTGKNIPTVPFHIRSWKHFAPGTAGYYWNRSISLPLTRSRNSNIVDFKELRHTGAHEEVHAANSYLTSTYNTPRLGEYARKFLKVIPNNYFLPNKAHPISKKYYNRFIFGPLAHGRFPEEHYANFMGAKASGRNFIVDNFDRELNLTPKGFIQDYRKYLSDTYSNIFTADDFNF